MAVFIKSFFSTYFILLICLCRASLADVEFNSPKNLKVQGGKELIAEWKQTNSTSIPESSQFDLWLCAAGNNEESTERLSRLVEGQTLGSVLSNDNTYTRFGDKFYMVLSYIPSNIGENHPNAYFLQLIIDPVTDPMVIQSQRFGLDGMTGSFSPSLFYSIQSLADTETTPPSLHALRVQKRQAAVAATATANIAHAPMPKYPPTKLNIHSAKPLYPTSSYEIATTPLDTPTVKNTVTASNTFSTSSIENTASPLPTNNKLHVDMKRFLNRWRDDD